MICKQMEPFVYGYRLEILRSNDPKYCNLMLEQVFWACPPIGLKVKPDESRPHTYPQSLLSGIGLKPSTYTPEQSDLSDKTWDRPKPTVRVYKSDQITWNIGI